MTFAAGPHRNQASTVGGQNVLQRGPSLSGDPPQIPFCNKFPGRVFQDLSVGKRALDMSANVLEENNMRVLSPLLPKKLAPAREAGLPPDGFSALLS